MALFSAHQHFRCLSFQSLTRRASSYTTRHEVTVLLSRPQNPLLGSDQATDLMLYKYIGGVIISHSHVVSESCEAFLEKQWFAKSNYHFNMTRRQLLDAFSEPEVSNSAEFEAAAVMEIVSPQGQ